MTKFCHLRHSTVDFIITNDYDSNWQIFRSIQNWNTSHFVPGVCTLHGRRVRVLCFARAWYSTADEHVMISNQNNKWNDPTREVLCVSRSDGILKQNDKKSINHHTIKLCTMCGPRWTTTMLSRFVQIEFNEFRPYMDDWCVGVGE